MYDSDPPGFLVARYNIFIGKQKKQSNFSPAFFCYHYYFDILGFNLLSDPLLRSLPDLRSGIYEVYENCRLSIPMRRPPLSGSVLAMAKITCSAI